MKQVLLNPINWVGLVVAVGAAIFGQLAIAALGVLVIVANTAFLSMKTTRDLRDEGVMEDLSQEERSQLAPHRKLRNEIRDLVEAKSSEVSIAVVGVEALKEADHMLEQCAKLVHLRHELRKSLSDRGQSARELDSLRTDLLAAGSEEERKTLQSAIDARMVEETHYKTADASLERIESGLRQAQAALSEMKARFATSSASIDDQTPADEISQTIGNMKALTASLDEAEEWLKGQA